MSNLQIVTQDIYSARPAFDAALCDDSISFEREAGFAIQVLSANEYALGLAGRNRQSVVNALVNVAAIGLSLNPAKKQAYLVPRKTGIVLEISYIGLVELAVASGSVRWVKADIVRANDGFQLNGYGQPPTHSCNPFATREARGEVVGVYCVAKTADGDYLTDTMSIEDVYGIRERSEAWARKQSGPWATDHDEMVKKTMVKRASKLWPKTERLDSAVHHLNTDAGEGLAVLAPVHTGFDLEAALTAVQAAQTRAELDGLFAELGAQATKAKDGAGWRSLKAACKARSIEIAQVSDVQPKEEAHA